MKTLEQLGISPAPWNHYRDLKITSPNGILIDDDWDNEGGYAVCISKSDARLMAAAPELYEALRMYQEAFAEIRKSAWFLDANFQEIMCLNKVMTAADAALAKAAGESEVER